MFNRFLKTGVMLLSVGAVTVLHGQDIHYTDVQGMSQWYNASLKQYRHGDVKLNMRDIRYQSQQAFQTGTALVNVQARRKGSDMAGEERSFATISGGLAYDKSNNGLFRNTMGLLGVSYAINLNGNGLYMAAGFQGLLTNYRLGGNGTYQDQYDPYGSIQRSTLDPLRVGKSFMYASLNAGWSMFERREKLDWYVGLSLRHVNRPFTEETKSTLYRLPMTAGVQGGVSLKTAYSRVDLFGMLNRKAKAHETIAGIRYNFLMGDNSDGMEGDGLNQPITLGFGVLYRVRDAIIPEIQLGVGKTGIGLHYDMNMSGIRASGFTRRGFEIQLTQKF